MGAELHVFAAGLEACLGVADLVEHDGVEQLLGLGRAPRLAEHPRLFETTLCAVAGVERFGMLAEQRQRGIHFAGGGQHATFVEGQHVALLGGHVMAISEGAGWIPHVEAGKMRLLAIWSEKRHPRLPDVPTLTELCYPFIFDSPFGLAGPKGMDPAIVKKLHDAFKAAQADPKARELQKRYEYVDRYMDSAAYTKFVVEQVAEQKAAIELLGLAKKN